MKIAILGILILAVCCNGYVIRCYNCPQLEKAVTRAILKPRTSAVTSDSPVRAASTTTSTTTTTAPTTTTTSAATSPAAANATASVGSTEAPTVAPAEPATVGGGLSRLAFTLRKQLPARKNAVMSPLSIASVLAALQIGARGTTRSQIGELLGQHSYSDEAFWLQLGTALKAINESKAVIADLANAVVLDNALTLNPDFEKNVKQTLSSEAFTVDFAGNPEEATGIINEWVSNNTQAKIPQILKEPVDSDTVLAVASALYFNGAWNEQFLTDETRRDNFTVSEDEVVEVDMMYQETAALYAYDEATKCQVLGLPYKDIDFALFLLLPNEPGVAGLERLESSLTPTSLLQLLSSTDWNELPYFVPRMRLEASFELSEALINAGVKDMFDATKADLSGVFSQNNGSVPVLVNQVVHSVVMDVTESGTEAAAATVATSSRSGSRLVFRASRPFLFVLQHRPSGVPLFWGSVVRPTPYYPISKQ